MDIEDEHPKSEYELLRERNIREREAFFAALDETEEFAAALKDVQEFSELINKPKPPPRRKKSDNQAFRYRGQIPTERRRSARLQNMAPSQENQTDTTWLFESSPKYKRRIRRTRGPLAPIIPPEEITANQLDKIAKRSSEKVYSAMGTTCHQCRQKTADTKTICRSGRCIGVRGQFCGPCLKGRYAEDVAKALMDPNWSCPKCRDICNCSFCRTEQGKVPTGILAPMVQQKGYKSVQDFLVATEKENEKDDYQQCLLGFDGLGKPVLTEAGSLA